MMIRGTQFNEATKCMTHVAGAMDGQLLLVICSQPRGSGQGKKKRPLVNLRLLIKAKAPGLQTKPRFWQPSNSSFTRIDQRCRTKGAADSFTLTLPRFVLLRSYS